MRRRFVLTPLFAVVFMASLQPSSVAAIPPAHSLKGAGSVTVTIYDPQDVTECPPEVGADCAEDIRSVSLRSYTGGTGRLMLAVTVEAYKLHGGLVVVESFKLRSMRAEDRRQTGTSLWHLPSCRRATSGGLADKASGPNAIGSRNGATR